MSGAQTKIMAAMVGKNARLVFFEDSEKTLLDFKTWTLKPNVTKHADAINGATRDELDKTLNYYELNGEMYMRDAEVLDQYLKAQAPRDANTQPLDEEGAIRFEPNDGTRRSFVLVGLIWDDFEINQSGRASKIMVPVTMRCEDVVAAKSI